MRECATFLANMTKAIRLLILFGLLSATATAAVRTWDGGGTDGNWGTAANWTTDVAPVAGDDLVFPATSAQFATSCNIGFLTTFNTITVEGGAYTFGGNPIRLSNGISATGGTPTFNLAITLAGPQTILTGTGVTLTTVILSIGSFPVTIDGPGITGIGLLSGSGVITKNGLGAAGIVAAAGYSGGLIHNNGIFVVDANIPSSTVNINSTAPSGTAISGFGGTGTVGHTNVNSGVLSAGTLTSPTGILNINNGLTFSADGNYVCKISGTTPGANGHDQLNVTGSVILNNARLGPLPLNGFQPAVNDTFVILRNDGTDAIGGTFLGVPEGAVFSGPLNTAFQITYLGGDGNDVSIKRVARAPFDFDGDGRTDISVFRPPTGTWYSTRSSDGSVTTTPFGQAADNIVPADFDGDNKTDVAVFRPSNGHWYILRSSDQTFTISQWGADGDIPIPNDFDGDGRADLGVFRPSNGTWYQKRSLLNDIYQEQFGQVGDVPLMGDFDGDGIGDVSIFREGVWYVSRSSDGEYAITQWGLATDRPTAADYDGDGTTDLAVYRDGNWYILGSTQGFIAYNFGLATDRPVPADYDGDGRSDVAVYRDGAWYLLGSTAGFSSAFFGNATDRPVPSAFN